MAKKPFIIGTNHGEDYEWEDLCEALTDAMGGCSVWTATVSGFGWRSIGGVIERLEAQTGRALLLGVLPQTMCSFKIYRAGKGFLIDNAHHDKPMGGEIYTIKPFSQR